LVYRNGIGANPRDSAGTVQRFANNYSGGYLMQLGGGSWEHSKLN